MFEQDVSPYDYLRTPTWSHQLVIGLYASFIVCLLGVWCTGNLFGTPNRLLPSIFMHYLESYPVAILLIPLIVLLIFYLLLRTQTGEIMSMPEHYLDERQKMIRDQAHRYAYRIIKVMCLIVPVYLCLHAIFWPGQAILPTQTTPGMHVFTSLQQVGWYYTAAHAHSMLYLTISVPPATTSSLHNAAQHILFLDTPHLVYQTQMQPTIQAMPTWPHDVQSMMVFYGTLLLSIFVLVASLPMSVVAWKRS
jgi:hypothetical protein